MFKIQLTRMPLYNGVMPTLRIDVIDDIHPSGRVGYLQPFRAYTFQVSGTPDGKGDCGSSAVADLPAKIAGKTDEEADWLLRDDANHAIGSFVGSNWLVWRSEENVWEFNCFMREAIEYLRTHTMGGFRKKEDE